MIVVLMPLKTGYRRISNESNTRHGSIRERNFREIQAIMVLPSNLPTQSCNLNMKQTNSNHPQLILEKFSKTNCVREGSLKNSFELLHHQYHETFRCIQFFKRTFTPTKNDPQISLDFQVSDTRTNSYI